MEKNGGSLLEFGVLRATKVIFLGGLVLLRVGAMLYREVASL